MNFLLVHHLKQAPLVHVHLGPMKVGYFLQLHGKSSRSLRAYTVYTPNLNKNDVTVVVEIASCFTVTVVTNCAKEFTHSLW